MTKGIFKQADLHVFETTPSPNREPPGDPPCTPDIHANAKGTYSPVGILALGQDHTEYGALWRFPQLKAGQQLEY